MMKKIVFMLMLLSSLLCGCKKINETDQATLTTKEVFRTSNDIENMLYGAYSAIASDNALAGYWRVFPELLADHVAINLEENLPLDPYVKLYDRKMAEAQYAQSWDLAYTAIQNANLIIYAIENNLITHEKDPTFVDSKRDGIKGEAYFIRGLAYFELIRFYGQQYGFNSAAANSGVILRIKPVLNVTKPSDVIGQGRTTVEAVYQQIISDLKAAEQLIPPASDKRGRASNFAASAILARVYFQMNDYPNALNQVNGVIGNTPGVMIRFPLYRNPATGTLTAAQAATNVLTPFSATGAATAAVSETIFDLVSATNTPVNVAISRKYLKSAIVNSQLSVSNAFLTDAAFLAGDQRGTAAGLLNTFGTKKFTKKYDRVLQNVPVIRSAELLLDRAEINAMNAVSDPQAHADAIADLNLLRGRAIVPYVNATTATITAANILAEVRKERIRELAFEGDRLHNLRRMHAVIGPGDRPGIAAIAWNSNKLLFKIPDAEIKTSTNIVQNPDGD